MDAAEALMRGSAQVAREWRACSARVARTGRYAPVAFRLLVPSV